MSIAKWVAMIATGAMSGCAHAETEATTASAPAAACANSEHRQFDFWIGEWNVVFSATNEAAGHSVVESLYQGCTLRENWTGRGGYSGGSLNAYDPSDGKWKQTWVGSDGAVSFYTGRREGESMVFLAQGVENGAAHLLRMTFTPLADGAVRQHIERSNDGGVSWADEYDLRYIGVR